MEDRTKSTTETPILDVIERHPESYIQAAWAHFKVEGRGVLFAMTGPQRGVRTVYMVAGEARRYFREKGYGWLNWFKGEVRPEIRSYDPSEEVVVLTCPDGPCVRVVSPLES